jgi:hypothetical protein
LEVLNNDETLSQEPTNTDALSNNKWFFLRLLISILLLTFSGIFSTYIYYHLEGKGGVYFPGLLYTSTTILIFLLTKKNLTLKKLSIYYSLMMVTYLLVWLLTMLSSWFAFLAGILTAGIGAIASFALVDRFIINLNYKKVEVFAIGSLAFLLTDILYWTFNVIADKTPSEYLFKAVISPNLLFLEVFIFWHILVATRLFLTLEKAHNHG